MTQYVAGDGCNPDCTIVLGWVCVIVGVRSNCSELCGNGYLWQRLVNG